MRYSSIKNSQNLLPASMKKRNSLSLLLCASAAFVLLQASDAHATTTLSAGITVDKSVPNKTTYNQTAKSAIITVHGTDFNIAEGSWTEVSASSANSTTLARIFDENPTQILGKLSANGKLMVVNKNGVFFGKNSRVDVASLIASTADTTDEDFFAGKTNLSIAGKAGASIVNKGAITAAEGGLVALVAPNVRNDGVIQANMGTVALASAQTASVDFYGDNLYSFALDKETTAAAQGEKSAVANSGIISVGGGKVLLTAKVAKGVVDNVINNTGIIEASSAHMEGGTVVLDGGDGNVNVSGKINASGATGGKITVTGENITLAAADINASGKNGGGTVKIGGDYQGKGSTPHAKTVKVDKNSKINVSATDAGNGGTSVVWSDEATSFSGSILGTAGVNGGNGGLAEVSSKGKLGYNGFADLHATNGSAGTLFLDPGNLTLANAGFVPLVGDFFVDIASIVTTLNTGTNSVQTATNNLNVLNNIIWGGAGSLTLNAGNNINLSNADISAASGNITANSVGIDLTNSSIKSATGDVTINNTGKFNSNLANVLEGHSVTLHQSTAGTIQNAINAVGTTGAGGALLQLGNGTWSEAVNVNQGNFTIKGNGSANTTIKAPSVLSTVISVGAGNDDVTISDLIVANGRTGISVLDNSNFKLNNSYISGAAHSGLLVDGTTDALVTGNTFYNNHISIAISNAIASKIDSNLFSNNTFGVDSVDSLSTEITNNQLNSNIVGMSFGSDKDLTINNNNIYYSAIGIALLDVVDAPITHNYFNYVDSGIIVERGDLAFIDNNTMDHVNYGVDANNSANITVTNNILNGDDLTGYGEDQKSPSGSYAIHVVGGTNSIVSSNTIDNFVMSIGVETSANNNVNFNNITNTVEDAIFLNGNDYTVALGNTINKAANGIHATSNVNGVDLVNNNISKTSFGILADNNTPLSIRTNKLYDNNTGADVLNSDGTIINSNIISNNIYGLVVENSHNVNLNTNSFDNNVTAASFYDSNNATLAGDVFTGNILGINLNNSKNTAVREATINSPASGVGMLIENSSSGTLVRGLNITGGGVGIILDGAGSSMQFEENTSVFTGQGSYFVLQNNAMFSETLVASAQTFDGTRASDFTVAQRDAAEGITTDIEDGFPTIGNVFYKDFSASFNTDGLIPTQKLPLNAGLFSYAGRTINNDPSVTPPTYYVAGLNLSLLSPTAGGAAGVIPAGLTPSQLGGLEPAAGGDNAQSLASLEPAAGGEPNCGNSFLGAGFNNNFDAASCSVKQQ